MPADIPIYYWDSCVFLALINREQPHSTRIEAAMVEADNGKIAIYTSIFTIAEVAYAGEESSPGSLLDDAALARIDKLWTPASPIKLVDFHIGIAERARKVIREALNGGVHKPHGADAVHMASALDVNADEIHTYNTQDYTPVGNILGLTIKHPEPLVPTLPL